jgi:hypothetical protein
MGLSLTDENAIWQPRQRQNGNPNGASSPMNCAKNGLTGGERTAVHKNKARNQRERGSFALARHLHTVVGGAKLLVWTETLRSATMLGCSSVPPLTGG